MSRHTRRKPRRRFCARCRDTKLVPAPEEILWRSEIVLRASGSMTDATVDIDAPSPAALAEVTQELLKLGASTDGTRAFFQGALAVRFWTVDAPALAARYEVLVEDGATERGLCEAPLSVHVLVTAGSERVGAHAQLGAGDLAVDEADLSVALGDGRSVVRLEDGSYARLASPEAARSVLEGPLKRATGEGMWLSHREAGELEGVLHGLGKVRMAPGTDRLFQAMLAGSGPLQPKSLRAHLRSYQEAGLAWLRFIHDVGSGGVLADDMGLGKDQPVSTMTPTPEGWRSFGSLKVGDRVFGTDGKPTLVTGVFPQGLKPTWRVRFSDGAEVRCGTEHLWRVFSANQKFLGHKGRVMKTDQIREEGLRDKAGNSRFFVPVIAPVEYDPQTLPIHPYVLGALIANGSMTHSCLNHSGGEDQRALMSPLMPEGTAWGVLSKGCTRTILGSASLKASLRQMGMWGSIDVTKKIPDPYMIGSMEQRLALLQGLMDNDGTVSKDGIVSEYNTISVKLADQVVELVRSLGGIARMSTRTPHYTYKGQRLAGQTDHRIRVSLPPSLCPFRLPRKVERFVPRTKYPPARAILDIVPDQPEESMCISVDAADKLYATDGYVMTHNTIQTIALLCSVREDEGHAKALVVAPTSVAPNWMRELSKFAPHLRAVHWQGPKRHEKMAYLAQAADIVVTSYTTMRNDLAFLNSLNFDYAVLDEAQAIKSHDSSSAKAAKQLRALHRLAISGTPIENRLTEFWSLFDFTSPGLLGTLSQFKQAAANIQAGDKSAVARLRQQVGPFLLRRDKREVATDLPDCIEQDYLCPMTERQAELYRDMLESTRLRVREGNSAPQARMHVLAAITRLRQIACDPRLIGDTGYGDADSGKLAALMDLLSGCIEGGHRVIVFSQFADMLYLIKRRLEAEKINHCYLDGSTRDRMGEVEKFQADASLGVFLISLKAGGAGINITAADTVVIFDPWWNPAVEAQAYSRAHRIGQTRTVTVYRLISEGTIEERVSALKDRKAKLASDVLADPAAFEQSVTVGDMQALLA